VDAVQAFKMPTKIPELQMFLGMVNSFPIIYHSSHGSLNPYMPYSRKRLNGIGEINIKGLLINVKKLLHQPLS
jgi:hypothetical protein